MAHLLQLSLVVLADGRQLLLDRSSHRLEAHFGCLSRLAHLLGSRGGRLCLSLRTQFDTSLAQGVVEAHQDIEGFVHMPRKVGIAAIAPHAHRCQHSSDGRNARRNRAANQ